MEGLKQQARRLAAAGGAGTLSTWSSDRPGWPFGSLALYAADAAVRPVLLLSGLAVHTRNLAVDPRASLLVTEPGAADPLAAARLTLLGTIAPVAPGEIAAARELYLARHPQAATWASFGDFAFYRMEVEQAYFVGGFGVMGWIRF